MSPRAGAATRPTMGGELERLRLEHRARRLEHALRRLRHRARAVDAGPTRRAGLVRAVADVSGELEQVRDRLGRSAGDGS